MLKKKGKEENRRRIAGKMAGNERGIRDGRKGRD